MDVVESPETSGVAEPANEEVQETQPELELEPPEAVPLQEAEDVLIAEAVVEPPPDSSESLSLKAVIEAAIYVTDEPLTPEQIATAVEQPLTVVNEILQQLVAEYAAPGRGLAVRELAGGYKVSTKPEYHESIRRFVKRLQPPLKLSLAALETLAVIAYKQPITGPEILDIRGVQGAGVLKTLLDRKLIATAGRKNVLGKPMMYKTTREFLIQFGLDSLAELPTLKEFEELGRLALTDEEVGTATETPPSAETKPDTEADRTVSEEAGAVKTDQTGDNESNAEETLPAQGTPAASASEEPAGLPETDHADANA
jgi:segregation and condensation protein B